MEWNANDLGGDRANGSQLKSFLQEKGFRYPLVVLDQGNGNFKEILRSDELNRCKGDAEQFVLALKDKGLMQRKDQQALL